MANNNTTEAIAHEAVKQMLFWGEKLGNIADGDPQLIKREINDQDVIHIREYIALVSRAVGLPPAGELTTPSSIPI